MTTTRKISISLAALSVLLLTSIVLFFRPIDYFGDIYRISDIEVRSSDGVEVPILSDETLLSLLQGHDARRNLNLTRAATSIIPSGEYLLIDFRWGEYGGMKSLLVDLESSIVKFTGNIQNFIDFYYLTEPDRFIEELLGVE